VKLAQRLLLGAVLIVSVLTIVAVTLSSQRLDKQLQQLTSVQLSREARLIAQLWRRGVEPDPLADSAGAALGHRVTLVDSSGHVLGDSEFDGPALAALQNHNSRPEIVEARRVGLGSSRRVSPSEGDEELYVAVRSDDGRVARVSIGTAELDRIVARASRDVLVSGLVALVIALGLATVFSRQISAPVTELRDVASAIAAGDLSKRPPIYAPGEVGELALAVQRMAEQLGSRMRALEAEDEFLGALVESLNEGVVAVDRQRRVIRINRSGRQLLDARAETPFSVDLLPRDRTLQDALAEALAGGVVERVETQIAGRTLALTARPLGEGGGGGAVLALFDLTGVRRLETVRRDFVANVSHELKTPLTAIRGFAETLASELGPDQQHAKFAETIKQNAERMQRLIDDLLDLSRIESGGWAPTPVRVDVAAAAAEAIAPYRDEAKQRGSSIQVNVDPAAATLRADPVALRQALGNLIENAVRYTPNGGTITIFSRLEDHGVSVGVRDTGAGIPSEHLPRIFERFYRVDPARSRAAGGTGLGLAIVKHLVEAHGGRVRAESQAGRGTTVSLFFPTAS
jgi:two-component system, OmpR family, phosphate regulon sensor histidine kinase PhoR